VALESGNSIKATESKILFDKKTMIEGNTTTDGEIRKVQTKPSPVEAPTSVEAPSWEDEDVLAEEAILAT